MLKSKYRYLLILIISFSLVSCTDENSSAGDCDLGSRICTEEFRSITLEIKDSEGNPVILDDFYTFLDSRKKFEFELNAPQEGKGIYPVITDSELDQLDKEGTILVFVGVLDGKNVVEHQIVIGHDCCHVQLLQGNLNILIEE